MMENRPPFPPPHHHHHPDDCGRPIILHVDDMGGGSGTTNYTMLANKPKINGHELVGDKTNEDLGIPTKASDLIDDGTYVKELVQSDWNENDVTNPAYIKNRPFYTGLIPEADVMDDSIVIHNYTEYGYGYKKQPNDFLYEEGKTYQVVWDGNIYEFTAQNKDGKVTIGDFDTEPYFESYTYTDTNTGENVLVINYPSDADSNHIVKITEMTEGINPLPAEYLPPELLSDIETLQTDVEDTKQDVIDLENKIDQLSPFETETIVDGTYDLEPVDDIYQGTTEPFTIDPEKEYQVTIGDKTYPLTKEDDTLTGTVEIDGTEAQIELGEDGTITVKSDDPTFEPESITLTAETVPELKDEFIEQSQSDWDEVDSSSAHYIQNKPVVNQNGNTITFFDVSDGIKATMGTELNWIELQFGSDDARHSLLIPELAARREIDAIRELRGKYLLNLDPNGSNIYRKIKPSPYGYYTFTIINTNSSHPEYGITVTDSVSGEVYHGTTIDIDYNGTTYPGIYYTVSMANRSDAVFTLDVE